MTPQFFHTCIANNLLSQNYKCPPAFQTMAPRIFKPVQGPAVGTQELFFVNANVLIVEDRGLWKKHLNTGCGQALEKLRKEVA